MQIHVVSLKRTPQRLENFIQKNTKYLPGFKVFDAIDGNDLSHFTMLQEGFDSNKDWRDPNLHRTLTRGEIGCFMSHWKLWEMCVEANEPFMILEDDIVFERQPDLSDDIGDADLLYLDWKEMKKAGAKPGRPCYPYWTCAYIITPKGAKTLLDTNGRKNIIPVDEFLSCCTDKLRIRGVEDSPCSLMGATTQTEPHRHSDYLVDFDTHVFTVGSDQTKCAKLYHSWQENGVPGQNIYPKDLTWDGGLQNFKTGGGIKLNILRKKLERLPDHDVVIFTDEYDVFFADNVDNIVLKYLSFKCEVLVSAERYNWPVVSSLWFPSHTPYRYLCSGMFIGRVRELKCIINQDLQNDDSDQLFLQRQYLTGRYDMKLDHEAYIFCNYEEEASIVRKQIFNPVTKCYSSIFHGNGGEQAKTKFNAMYTSMYPPKNYITAEDYDIIGDEMLLIDYKTPRQCAHWIKLAEELGGFKPHHADSFPSHDIHLKLIPGLWEESEQHWNDVVAPIIERYWRPLAHHHLRKAFIMKYSSDTQRTLGLHNDSSLVTGSVKLNDDYEGATLYWPRQGISNSDIPVGKMVLFPSQVTHGHYVDELKSGTKYSATFWTARFKGELLDP